MSFERFDGELPREIEDQLRTFFERTYVDRVTSLAYSHVLLNPTHTLLNPTPFFHYSASINFFPPRLGEGIGKNLRAKIFEGKDSSTVYIHRWVKEHLAELVFAQDDQEVIPPRPGRKLPEIHHSTLVIYRKPSSK